MQMKTILKGFVILQQCSLNHLKNLLWNTKSILFFNENNEYSISMARFLFLSFIFKPFYFRSYLVTPIILPGSSLRNSFLVEKNPAWGPPYPIGIPNRWLDPTAMSTPNSPGGRSMVSAIRSVAQVTRVWKKYMTLSCATSHEMTVKWCVHSPYTLTVVDFGHPVNGY